VVQVPAAQNPFTSTANLTANLFRTGLTWRFWWPDRAEPTAFDRPIVMAAASCPACRIGHSLL